MKKKLFLYFLCMAMLFSGINLNVLAAEESSKKLVVDSVRCDNNMQYVTVKGHLSDGKAFADILIEVLAADTDKSVLNDYLGSMESIAQITTDKHGEFEYSFPVGRTNREEFDVYVTAPYSDEVSVTRLKLYNTGSEDELLDSSVIMQAGNRLAIKKNSRIYTDYAPYMSGGDLMIETEALAQCFDAVVNGSEITINGITKALDTVSNGGKSYVKAAQLAEFGLYVHISESMNAAVVTEKTGENNYEKMTEALGIYMSNGGSDDNDGSFNAPVKSIEKAIALAAARNYNIGRCVYVREGSYRLTKSVDIENVSNLYITSYCDENVVFTGGAKLNKDDFTLLADTDKLARVKPSAKGKIYTLDLSKYMSVVNSDVAVYEDGILANVAKYPDSGYTMADFKGANVTLNYADKRMWKNEPNGKLFGYFSSEYQSSSADITVGDDMTIKSSLGATRSSIPVYAYNMLCEADAPGEWYIEGNTLYYYPIGNLENVEITDLRFELFNIKNSENITLDGIVAEMNRNDAILISGSKKVSVLNSEIRRINGTGINIKSSFDTTIDGCKLHDMSCNAVFVDNCGKYLTLQSGNTQIRNSRIYNFANTGNVNYAGVRVSGGMDTLVYGCVIHDSAAQGVAVGGGYGHTVEKCEVYNVTNYMSDAGAIYFNTGVLGRGSKVKDNYIHDIQCGYPNHSLAYAIYMDDFTGGAEVSGNTIANAPQAGKIGGGRDLSITNNIIIGAYEAIDYDNRGEYGGMFHPSAMAGSAQQFNGTDGGLYDDYFKMKSSIDVDEWDKKYPGFKKLVEDIEKEREYWIALHDENATQEDKDSKKFNAALPVNSVITENVAINATGREIPVKTWWLRNLSQYDTIMQNNLSVANKALDATDEKAFLNAGNTRLTDEEAAKTWFENYADNNYQLKSGNPISTHIKGFVNNDLSATGTKIGTNGIGSPKLIAPSNGTRVKNTADFKWRKTGEGDYFMLEISKNADMSNPVYTEITNRTMRTVTLDEGTYYWRTTALDKSLDRAESAKSEVYTVNVSGDYVAVKDYGFKQNDSVVAKPTAGTAKAYINSEFVKLRNDNAVVIFVLKSADGQTKDISTAEVSEENNSSDIEYEFTYADGDSVEMFIWSNTGDMYPYTNKIVID